MVTKTVRPSFNGNERKDKGKSVQIELLQKSVMLSNSTYSLALYQRTQAKYYASANKYFYKKHKKHTQIFSSSPKKIYICQYAGVFFICKRELLCEYHSSCRCSHVVM